MNISHFDAFFNSLSLKYSETTILTTSGTVAIFLVFLSISRASSMSLVIATVILLVSTVGIPALEGIRNPNIPYASIRKRVIDGICQPQPNLDKKKGE